MPSIWLPACTGPAAGSPRRPVFPSFPSSICAREEDTLASQGYCSEEGAHCVDGQP